MNANTRGQRQIWWGFSCGVLTMGGVILVLDLLSVGSIEYPLNAFLLALQFVAIITMVWIMYRNAIDYADETYKKVTRRQDN